MTEISGNVDAMEQMARTYREAADDILSKTEQNVEALRIALQTDASRFTQGGPAPVYQPLIDELNAASQRYLEGATKMRDRLHADADALHQLAQDYRNSGEAAEADLRSIGDEVAGTGTSAGSDTGTGTGDAPQVDPDAGTGDDAPQDDPAAGTGDGA